MTTGLAAMIVVVILAGVALMALWRLVVAVVLVGVGAAFVVGAIQIFEWVPAL